MYAPMRADSCFRYAGRYYAYHHGAWLSGATHSGPWATVSVEQVPPPVLAVPMAATRARAGGGTPRESSSGPASRQKTRDQPRSPASRA